MNKPQVSDGELTLLTEYVRSILGTMASATEQVPPHLRSNFIASIAASALATLAEAGARTTLRHMREEIDRLLAGGQQKSPHIITGPHIGPDTAGNAH
jgi:hypothetical protein